MEENFNGNNDGNDSGIYGENGNMSSMNSNVGSQPNPMPQHTKQGLGIAAMVLGGLSVLCCSCIGLGAIMALIGAIFSIICLVKGTGRGKTFGIVGIILNGIGLLLGIYMLASLAMMIDWSNVTPEALNQINEIDPNNEQEVLNWMQQFFKVDLSQMYSTSGY